MSTTDYLKQYIPLVDFLGELCGPGCEIALHDVSSPDYSIIAIRNPLTGNMIGCPLSGLSIDFSDKSVYEGRKYITNYIEELMGKRFLSSVFFIKVEGELVGVLSINKDLSPIEEGRLAVKGILSHYNLHMSDETGQNGDSNPVVELLHNMISQAIYDMGVPPARMSLNEKVRLVHKLSTSGVLMIDGAITEIATQLNISEPTVYRYLNRRIN